MVSITTPPKPQLEFPNTAHLPKIRSGQRLQWKWMVGFLAWPAAAFVVLATRTFTRLLAQSPKRAFAALALSIALALSPALAAGGQTVESDVVRGALNAPFSVAAIAWGLSHGGEITVSHGIFVITGMTGGHGPRHEMTVGDVALTSKSGLSSSLLRHESVHTDQWAALGIFFSPSYEVASLAAGGDPTKNAFEIQAGLKDGGYESGIWVKKSGAQPSSPPGQG